MEDMIKLIHANQLIMEYVMKIVNGLWNGTVRLISNPDDGSLACEIGEHWFNFLKGEDKYLKPEEVRQHYDVFAIANKILDAMLKIGGEEYAYYKTILKFD